MQLLERNDGKKWFVWIAQGKVGKEHVNTKLFAHFNRVDAVGDFEKKFFASTDNKWTERENFKEHPGKYILVIKERELEKMHNALVAEREITQVVERALSPDAFEKT